LIECTKILGSGEPHVPVHGTGFPIARRQPNGKC
jgi:hypothetical protein